MRKYNYIYNTAGILLTGYVIISLFRWAVLDASWSGTGPESCQQEGYCWIYVRYHVSLLSSGFYPSEQSWRIGLFYASILSLIIAKMGTHSQTTQRILTWALWLQPSLALIYLIGGIGGIPIVETRLWGGLFLSIWLTFFCFSWAFPLGLLLACLRRSRILCCRLFAAVFIEGIRSLPLILVLFVFTFFSDSSLNISKIFNVALALTLFASAYIAEVFRGGFDNFPDKEEQIARSLGLSSWQTLSQIKLPQITRQVTPSFINILVGMFKDTTLVVFVGLFDLLAMIDVTTHNAKWLPMIIDAVLFVLFVYWLVCYLISLISEKLIRHCYHDD